MALQINKQRKIVYNNYSYQITLPKNWIGLHGLEKGSKISFEIGNEENGRSLILRPVKMEDDMNERKESPNIS